MKEIHGAVNAVRRRLRANLLLARFLGGLAVLSLILALGVLAAKLVFFPGAMDLVLPALLGAICMALLYAALFSRTRTFAAAVAADEKLRLGERLSTAILVAADSSPVARAVVSDARDFASRLRPSTAFPLRLPEKWWRSVVSILLLAGVLSLPQFDLFGRHAAFQREQQDRQEAAAEVERLQEKVAEMKKILGESDPETLEIIEDLQARLAELEKMGLNKKDTLAAVSGPLEKLADRMADLARDASREGQSQQADLSKALADSQLAEAKAQLEKLMAEMKDALEKGTLSEEQKDELAKAIEKLAQELNRAAQNGSPGQQAAQQLAQQLASQMSQAAQDMKAGNASQAAQSLQQAMTAMNTPLSGLNPMAASGMNQGTPLSANPSALQGQAGQMAGNSAQQLQQMANALQGLSQYQSNLTGGQSMSMAQALAQLQAAAAMGQGGNMPGPGSGTGPGMGGPGQGRGGQWDVAPDGNSTMQSSTIGGVMHPGRMLASYYTEGGTLKNESRVQYEEVVLESRQKAKDALTDQKVPRAYEKVVRDYFESLDAPQLP